RRNAPLLIEVQVQLAPLPACIVVVHERTVREVGPESDPLDELVQSKELFGCIYRHAHGFCQNMGPSRIIVEPRDTSAAAAGRKPPPGPESPGSPRSAARRTRISARPP